MNHRNVNVLALLAGLLFLWLAVCVSVAGASVPTPQGANAATGPVLAAPALAAAIDAHYDHLRSLSVQFTQSYDGMGMHRVERGTLLLGKAGRLRAGRMRWSYTEPVGKLFVFDGRFAYFDTPGQSEVQRVPAKQLDDLRSPLALLLGHAELARQLTGLTLTQAADGDSTLSGVPKGLERRLSSLQITASPAGVIHDLVVEEVDGSRSSFHFVGEQGDVPTPADAFVYTPPPGKQVVDGMPPI